MRPLPTLPPHRTARLRSPAGLLLALLSAVVAPLSAQAATAGTAGEESPAHLSHLAEQWLQGRHPWQGPAFDVHIQAQPLDPRTRLPACRQDIVISLPPGQSVGARTLLQLQCPDSPGWRLLQPVSIQARTEVLVASQAIQAGSALTASVVSRQWRDVATLSQGYLDPARGDTMRARMTIPAGAVIALPWVQALPVIRKGQQVNLQARLGGIVIVMAGETLSDGAAGERVRVRNHQSGKIVEGLVAADGSVETLP